MRLVIQRVQQAHVTVDDKLVGEIGRGMLVFLGVGKEDTQQDADDLVNKIVQLRIFDDPQGKMNLSSIETDAEFLVVSQFTLYGDCEKGRRPSFDKAADPQKGEGLYNYFVTQLRRENRKVETGQFRARMDVALINDGPVTLVLSSQRENKL